MFTGIVIGAFPVRTLERLPGLLRFSLEFQQDMLIGLEPGASVAVDGVCLTVVKIEGTEVSFEAMSETLVRTTIPTLAVGSTPNVERSMKVGSEVGGHVTSGHVDATAEICEVTELPNNRSIRFSLAPEYLRYVFPKGFIALDGMSLTVVDVDRASSTFSVWLIPETLRRTAIGQKKLGDRVNIEVHRETQTLVDTVTDLFHKHIALLKTSNPGDTVAATPELQSDGLAQIFLAVAQSLPRKDALQ